MDIVNPIFKQVNAFVWPFAAGMSAAFAIVLATRGEVGPAIGMGVIAACDVVVYVVVTLINNKAS